MSWLSKIAAELSDSAQERLNMAGAEVVESEEGSQYEIYLVHIPQLNIYQIGFQRKGLDFTDLSQQFSKTPLGEEAAFSLKDIPILKSIISRWISKYGTIYAISHNAGKTSVYFNLLNWLGFSPTYEEIMGQQVIALSK